MSNVRFTEPQYIKSRRGKKEQSSMGGWLIRAGFVRTAGQAQTVLGIFSVLVFLATLMIIWKVGLTGPHIESPSQEVFYGMQ